MSVAPRSNSNTDSNDIKLPCLRPPYLIFVVAARSEDVACRAACLHFLFFSRGLFLESSVGRVLGPTSAQRNHDLGCSQPVVRNRYSALDLRSPPLASPLASTRLSARLQLTSPPCTRLNHRRSRLFLPLNHGRQSPPPAAEIPAPITIAPLLAGRSTLSTGRGLHASARRLRESWTSRSACVKGTSQWL